MLPCKQSHFRCQFLNQWTIYTIMYYILTFKIILQLIARKKLEWSLQHKLVTLGIHVSVNGHTIWMEKRKKREFKRYTLTISIDYSCIYNILCKDYYWTFLKNDWAEKNVFQNGKIHLTSASQNLNENYFTTFFV